MMKPIVTQPFLAALVAVSASFASVVAKATDYVFTNANVYTVNEQQPWAEAVVVTGNKIAFVGSANDAKAFIGKTTRVLDLDGKMVLPGFVSGHEHLIASGFLSQGVNLLSATSKEETLQLIKGYADAHPDEEFILGYGWNADTLGGFPTAAELDTAVADRPAFLSDSTIHDSWLNTKALEMGGITAETKDPKPGFSYWVRDDRGTILGVGIELAWMPAYVGAGAWDAETLIPASQERLYRLGAEAGYTAYINQGLVTPNVQNLPLLAKDYEIAMRILNEQAEAGDLKLRTYIQYFLKDKTAMPEDVVAYASELRETFNTDLLRVTGIKIHPEGVVLTKTAKMLEPFADDPSSAGERGLTPEMVEAVLLAGNEAGFDVSVHVEGSQTTRTTIDAIIKAKEMGYSDARNSLQHFAVTHPDDMMRVIKHGIPVNLTPIWATTWSNGLSQVRRVLGEPRLRTMFQQIRTLVDAGNSVSIAADVPSTTSEFMSALMQCEAAITRKHPTDPAEVFPPMSQALTLNQCLYAATIGGAYQARMEDKIGSLEEGKYADLVVLEKNLFDVDPDGIAEVKVLATMMDGKFTHRGGL